MYHFEDFRFKHFKYITNYPLIIPSAIDKKNLFFGLLGRIIMYFSVYK